jgi:four helix bundle protein
MGFDHERFDVYQTALDFLEFTDSLIASLPRGRATLSDQLGRASLSILANVAEGAGKTSPADKRRHYTISRGAATESAALLDACYRLKLVPESEHRRGKEMLLRIVAMLVKLARSLEAR